MYYKTEILNYCSYEDLDSQLNKLEEKGWSACMLIDNYFNFGNGEIVITFKINDK